MSRSTVAHLWGMDGFLKGNEESFFVALPVIKVGSDIFAVRADDWSFSKPETLEKFQSEEEAKENVVQFSFAAPVEISEGQLVVAMGPKFSNSFREAFGGKNLGTFLPVCEFCSNDGFEISVMDKIGYRCLALMVSGIATNIFDDELKRSGGKLVSKRAEAALLVLRHIFIHEVEAIYIASVRHLAALSIKKDAEAYKLALAISAKQLEMNSDEIEARVREYLESVSS